jgi:hypothetical protein
VAEGWDDWGPFYTPMYSQHLGLNGSTVEMCSGTGSCGGRVGSRRAQYVITWSTLLFDADNRHDLYSDMITAYQRGDTDAPRPACCPAPFDVANNWMLDYPQAYVIPRGAGQRSDAEANRLVEWLLFNDIEVHELSSDYRYGGTTYEDGSYVVFMTQPRRGLADTALSIGVDLSTQIGRLYAPPGSWSHGYLWGADVVTIPDGPAFRPWKHTVNKPSKLRGGLDRAGAPAYALEIDSPTAVRMLNGLLAGGIDAQLARAPFTSRGASLPAGTVVFSGADAATIDAAGAAAGLRLLGVQPEDVGATEAVDAVPRIAVLTGAAVNQDIWSLRNLGFVANGVSTTTLNTASTDPLASYDVVFNSSSGYPSAANTTARARLTSFFASGGGYLGALSAGAAFLETGGQTSGLTTENRAGFGRSGIIHWQNTAGSASPVVGAYPASDTAIMDPPTWITGVPASMTVDGRLPPTGFFASGLWSSTLWGTAPGSPVIAHGTNTAGTARLAVFAMNPLYRADPEREWPMLSSAAYWADQ